jgi:hypothetical protein
MNFLLDNDYKMIHKLKKYNISKTNIDEVYDVLKKIKIYLTRSDQNGKKSQYIFDPKGTNKEIKQELVNIDWIPNYKIPNNHSSLGKDVDFYKNGVIIEVQFSNYPFLLNNVVRSELFFKNSNILNKKIECLVIITKVKAFPSSNSTLYFEQASNQLDLLSKNNLFSIPIILIGLDCEINRKQKVILTEYKETRHSKEIISEKLLELEIKQKTCDTSFSFGQALRSVETKSTLDGFFA